MPSPQHLAPYYLPVSFQPLLAYLTQGRSPGRWAEDQFALDVVVGSPGGPEFPTRCLAALTALDSLPLQVKDLMRGLIDELRLDPDGAFLPGTLSTWEDGVLRVNVDWPDIEAPARAVTNPARSRRVLLAGVVHECGHALVEDRRGGVPLRHYVRLLAAAGWLPHPLADQFPFRGKPNLDHLEAHLLHRLRQVDGRWDPDAPAAAPGQPGPAELDWHLDGLHGSPVPGPTTHPTVGLMPSSKLATELLAAATAGDLPDLLRGCGLTHQEVRAALARHPAVSPYAEEQACETPAEIFRCLQLERVQRSLPALEEGRRLLIRPWREAELKFGPREPARMPPAPRRWPPTPAPALGRR